MTTWLHEMFEHASESKDPLFSAGGWLTYIGVAAVSLWGGVVSYLSKMETFSWRRFIAHLSSSSFAGFMAYFACEWAGIHGPLLGVICGVAAHMGTPAIIRLAMRSQIIRNLLAEEFKERRKK